MLRVIGNVIDANTEHGGSTGKRGGKRWSAAIKDRLECTGHGLGRAVCRSRCEKVMARRATERGQR